MSIDTLPIFYWNKIHESGNLSYLVRTKNPFIQKKKPGRLESVYLKKVWRGLLGEFVDHFGLSENILDIDAKEVEIGKLKVERLINNDKTLTAFIQIAERELEELKKYNVSGDFSELKAAVELEWGHLNPLIVSVKEFHSCVKLLAKKKRQK